MLGDIARPFCILWSRVLDFLNKLHGVYHSNLTC